MVSYVTCKYQKALIVSTGDLQCKLVGIRAHICLSLKCVLKPTALLFLQSTLFLCSKYCLADSLKEGENTATKSTLV